MEKIIEKFINVQLISLVDYIVEKHEKVDGNLVLKKLEKLGFINTSVVEKTSPKKNQKKNLQVIPKRPVIKVKKSGKNYVLDPDQPYFEELKSSQFVLDTTSKQIVGTQNEYGQIEQLSKEQIVICNKFKLQYKIPLNLNVNVDDEIDQRIIDEIDELGLQFKADEEIDSEAEID